MSEHKHDTDDPEPPFGPHDDVQCRECGHYWYHTEGWTECHSCGADVDWEWNVATERIKQSQTPAGREVQ